MPGNGQTPASLSQVYIDRPSTIQDLTEKVAQVMKDSSQFLEVKKEVDRSLTFGVRQVYYAFFSKKHQLYELSVLAKKNKIFCVKMFAISYTSAIYRQKKYKELYSWLAPQVMQNYIDQHNQTFGVHLSLKDTFLLPLRLKSFGICGRTISALHHYQEELISRKDTFELQKWLRSMDIELQAYAIEGLARIKHPEKLKHLQVKEIRKSDIKYKILIEKYLWGKSDGQIILWLKKQPLKIRHCVGCFGVNFKTLKNHLQAMGF